MLNVGDVDAVAGDGLAVDADLQLRRAGHLVGLHIHRPGNLLQQTGDLVGALAQDLGRYLDGEPVLADNMEFSVMPGALNVVY